MVYELVNIVGVAQIADELNLADIAIQLNAEYEHGRFPGIMYKVEQPKTNIAIFSTGKTVTTGAKTIEEPQVALLQLITELRELGVEVWDDANINVEIVNMVANYTLTYPEEYEGINRMTQEPLAGQQRPLNLYNLTFHLRFDRVEYEPEQFPGLIYRIPEPKVVVLIFGSGKCVITGATNEEELRNAIEILEQDLAGIGYD
jgi:transcription initiation factor TFIID TATA-box-binding protein